MRKDDYIVVVKEGREDMSMCNGNKGAWREFEKSRMEEQEPVRKIKNEQGGSARTAIK